MRHKALGNNAFDDATVARIKSLLQTGRSPRDLAQAYDVALSTIRKIARGDTYAWVAADDYAEPGERARVFSVEKAINPPPPIDPEVIAAGQARILKMLAQPVGLKREIPDWLKPREAQPPVEVINPDELIRRCAEADELLRQQLAQRTGISIEVIKLRWLSCNNDRGKITQLVNELNRMTVKDVIEMKLEELKGDL